MQYSAKQLKEYEDFLESLRLLPGLFRIKDLEMDLKGNLNPSIYLDHLFFKRNKWLDFDQFYNLYYNHNKEIIKNQFGFANFDSFAEGLRARLYRTQFGFLTEYHAYFLASILFGSENVLRNTEMDRAGVDFRIKLNDIEYNIHIFVDSQRAWHYRNFKSKYKNVEKAEGIHTNLPYSLKPGRFNSLRFLKNRFGVYTNGYLEHFKAEALEGRIKNNNIIGTNEKGFIYSH